MANRPVLEIEVNDTEFQDFLAKWDNYKTQVAAMPQTWMSVSYEINNLKTKFEKVLGDLEKQTQKTDDASVSQGKFAEALAASELTYVGLAKSGKSFAHNIHQSTQSLMKWTKLTAVFSGILGAGGLFGIDRMAAGVAVQRTAAAGLGVSYGERASFLTNFGPLGNPEGILSGFSEGLATPTGKAQIAHLIGHQPTGDAAETAAEALPKFKEFADKTPDDQLGRMLDALGYSKLGLGVEQAKVIRGMPREEVERRSREYREGKTGLGLDPDTTRKWTDLTVQMERAGWQMETVLGKGLVNLAKPLTDLSNAFVHLAENLMKDGGPIKGWIDSLGKGLGEFDKAVGSKSFLDGADRIARDTTAIIRAVERLTTLSFKDVVAGMRSGMDASRKDIEQRYGKDWTAVSGLPWLQGAKPADPSSYSISKTKVGEEPQTGAAQEGTPWNHQLPPGPSGQAIQRGTGASPPAARGGTTTPGTRTDIQSTARTPEGETPVLGDATHHPARYQGTLSVDGQTFDYATGSSNRGRGSSPFGEHPITSFDPSAMHGRGGGAFRTKDVYDPQVRGVRGAVEIHMSNQDDIRRVETAGCFGIPKSEWPAAKASIQRFMEAHPEGATLSVHPDGHAEIVSRSTGRGEQTKPVRRDVSIGRMIDNTSSAQHSGQTSTRRKQFGHPHNIGKHPATLGQAQPDVQIDNQAGSLVQVH